MGTDQVVVCGGEGKACEQQESVSPRRRELDQIDLDEMLESLQRIRFVASSLWQMDEIDKVEMGTVSIMLNREAECIRGHMEKIEERLDWQEVTA